MEILKKHDMIKNNENIIYDYETVKNRIQNGFAISKTQEDIEMIALGCDHGGFELKEKVVAYLKEKNIAYKDFGCYSTDSCDYPVFAKAAAKAVASGECEKGIVICTTGIGISISANKIKGVRCALCSDSLSAKMTRLHNNANMLALGAGIIGTNLALDIVETFLNTDFSGEERHQRRIDLIEE